MSVADGHKSPYIVLCNSSTQGSVKLSNFITFDTCVTWRAESVGICKLRRFALILGTWFTCTYWRIAFHIKMHGRYRHRVVFLIRNIFDTDKYIDINPVLTISWLLNRDTKWFKDRSNWSFKRIHIHVFVGIIFCSRLLFVCVSIDGGRSSRLYIFLERSVTSL
jgi:hypothetical protein